jgi:vancomycin resistance protein VanW
VPSFSVRSVFKKIRRLVPFGVRVAFFRMKRRAHDLFSRGDFCVQNPSAKESFGILLFSHRAKLFRDYPEPWYSLQKNKVKNLACATIKTDYALIKPAQIFSFWRLVGPTKASKGYENGMTIADGTLTRSMGGGLCQLSNALYWVALHIGCDIVERHRHSFDFFPDSYRSVPFGAGATVYYNYVDLRFINRTEQDILIRTWMDSDYLHIDAYARHEPHRTYSVVEKNHAFTEINGDPWRSNDLYRIKYQDGKEVSQEHIAHNKGKVQYKINTNK